MTTPAAPDAPDAPAPSAAGAAGEDRRGGRDGLHRYSWVWDLHSTPAQLWPLLADTNRFDRDTGVPEVRRHPAADPIDAPTTGRVAVSTRQYGVRLDYEQDPWEWEAPHWLKVRRRFTSGPLATLDVDIRLDPGPTGGTRLTYGVAARPRHAIVAPAIPVQIGWIFARRFEATARRFDELARAGTTEVASNRRVRLGRAGARRLEDQAATLRAEGADPDVVDRLTDTIRTGDDTVAARLRPYALADHWGLDRRTVLDGFLEATRAGVVTFRWDLLCPECRAPKASVGRLRDLPDTVHCDTCNIDYGPSFAQSVELTFRPTPAVRVVDETVHCIGNPMATPHVVAQALLSDGGFLELTPTLEPGRYRFRAPGVAGGRYVRVVDAATADDDLTRTLLGPDGWPTTEVTVASGHRLSVENASGAERLVLFERTAWGDQAATAADVTSRQEFRDLFADEALRPGDHVSVGTLTIAFTDLRDSTRLYQQVGDAVAFGRVLDHFDVLRDEIAAEGGAIVKTIGDAVMAVFGEPAPAVRALGAAQRRLRATSGLHLKAGIHAGPCIAVTLNDQLDYFGSTVNLAARLAALSTGDDVVVTHAVGDDREVRAVIDGDGGAWPAEALRAPVKGFADEVELIRLRPNAPLAPPAG